MTLKSTVEEAENILDNINFMVVKPFYDVIIDGTYHSVPEWVPWEDHPRKLYYHEIRKEYKKLLDICKLDPNIVGIKLEALLLIINYLSDGADFRRLHFYFKEAKSARNLNIASLKYQIIRDDIYKAVMLICTKKFAELKSDQKHKEAHKVYKIMLPFLEDAVTNGKFD